jgi:hypothetical protein
VGHVNQQRAGQLLKQDCCVADNTNFQQKFRNCIKSDLTLISFTKNNAADKSLNLSMFHGITCIVPLSLNVCRMCPPTADLQG